MSSWKALQMEVIQYLIYTYILALFMLVSYQPSLCLSFWTVSYWTRVRDQCFIPFCEDRACQEGGVINYELKFTLSFRFTTDLNLTQQ